MTMPAFVSKGTAATTLGDICAATWSLAPTLPGTINAGDIIVLFVGLTVPAGTVTSFTTPSGYTLGASSGSGAAEGAAYYYKVAAGTEDGSTVTMDGSFDSFSAARVIAQAYVFSNSGAGGYHAVGGTNTGSSTTPAFTSLTTTEANELAVGLVWAGVNTTIGNPTGETGGDWTEAAAEDVASSRLLQCQTAGMASAGTLSGGTATLGSTGPWRTFSFALKEAAAAGIANKFVKGNRAVARASFF